MEELSKDILVFISLKLDISDVLSLSRSSKNIYTKIYNNKFFWMTKLDIDFHVNNNNSNDDDFKEKYIKSYKLSTGCKYIFMRGIKKGERCDYPKANKNSISQYEGGDDYCKACLKKSTIRAKLNKK